MNGVQTTVLDTSTLAICSPLAKFSGPREPKGPDWSASEHLKILIIVKLCSLGQFCPRRRVTVITPLIRLTLPATPFTGERRRRHGHPRASNHATFQATQSTVFSSHGDTNRGRASSEDNSHFDE